MDADNAVQKDSIRSESCLESYFAVITVILIAVLPIVIAVLIPVSDILQKKEDRKKAEENYTSYFSYDKGKNKSDLHYIGSFEINPRWVIKKGVSEGKSRDEIIEELIAAEKNNRWFGRLEYDNPAADAIRWAILTFIAVIICVPIAFAVVTAIQKKRYIIAEGGNVSFSRKHSTALSEVTGAETGSLRSVTVITNNRRYKRRFIRNNCEIVKFINEHCNNAAQ